MNLTKCEHAGCESADVARYILNVDDPNGSIVFYLCDQHAAEEGFCCSCGSFVLGSDDDTSLRATHLCAQCFEEEFFDKFLDDDYEDDWEG